MTEVPTWRHLFPFPAVRQEQETAIDFCLQSFAEGKRFVVCELGTGVGKSAIGLTVARATSATSMTPNYSPGAYFVTTQKVLQEQYASDFSTMRSIKSSANYSCVFHKDQGCDESLKMLKVEPRDSKFFHTCMTRCVYKIAKEAFLQSQESVTNFPYLLTEATYARKITPREILVIDEAHNVAPELSKFIEVVVTENFCERGLKIPFANLGLTEAKVIKWMRETYLPRLEQHIETVEKTLQNLMANKQDILEMLGITRQVEMLKSHKSKMDLFNSVYDVDNWVMNVIDAEGKSLRKIEFKPIDVAPFAEQHLFRLGAKVLLMSATILGKDAFCESIGIPKEEVAFISIPSPFPASNRPILYTPVGKMSKESIDSTLPRMVQAIKAILEAHPKEKGVIHCHTHKIATYLKKQVGSRRLLVHDSQNRDEILAKHMESTQPTVLLSPSMTEGVDLKGDASRFQVIVKIPYPYLGDKLCVKRMNRWRWWYPLQTAKTIIQAVGRSIRSMDDHAVTYILDEDWQTFFGRNKDLFPEEFKVSLQ